MHKYVNIKVGLQTYVYVAQRLAMDGEYDGVSCFAVREYNVRPYHYILRILYDVQQ